MSQRDVNTLICDLDNTLYDWFSYIVPSFYAMFEEAVEILDCDREVLLDDFRKVHQTYHDSEHPFSLLETGTVKSLLAHLPRSERLKTLDPAFHAFNSSRKKTLTLNHAVRSTLDLLSSSGITLIAHTESKYFAVVDRLHRLDLLRYFERVYCGERAKSSHPNSTTENTWWEDVGNNKITELSHHQMKPDPEVLLEICKREGAEISKTAYVGDSVARDVLMAKRAGVFAIWAAYGAEHDPVDYERLVRISHWTTEDVAREKELKLEATGVAPEYTCTKGFHEVLDALQLPVPAI